MKRFLIILFAVSLLTASACSEIDMDGESSSAEESTVSVTESTVGGEESSEDESTVTVTESSVNDSSVIGDSSEPDDSSVTPDDSSVTPDESSAEESSTVNPVYSYAVTLTEEELKCINAGADKSFLTLVNKENLLPADFVPENLVDIRNTRKDRSPEKMVYTAEVALHAFLKEAAYYGYGDVTVTSGYRSIAKQESLFNYYVSQEMSKGLDRASAEAAAAVYSAYPRTSEHHTGLCVDMHNLPAASQSFGSTEAAKWMAANAHRFGFILRFPQGKQDITGYMWEPWHFRFVGVYHATKIYEGGYTLEEYWETGVE